MQEVPGSHFFNLCHSERMLGINSSRDVVFDRSHLFPMLYVIAVLCTKTASDDETFFFSQQTFWMCCYQRGFVLFKCPSEPWALVNPETNSLKVKQGSRTSSSDFKHDILFPQNVKLFLKQVYLNLHMNPFWFLLVMPVVFPNNNWLVFCCMQVNSPRWKLKRNRPKCNLGTHWLATTGKTLHHIIYCIVKALRLLHATLR